MKEGASEVTALVELLDICQPETATGPVLCFLLDLLASLTLRPDTCVWLCEKGAWLQESHATKARGKN